LYDPNDGNYKDGQHHGNSYSQDDLQNFIQNGDTMSFMGVYPGTGAP
jgi:hypothetical protein